MKFVIYGEPVAKGRPRFRNVGSFVQTYTPQKTLSYENLVKVSFDEQVTHKEVILGEVGAVIKAYFSIPKSTSKKKSKLMDDGYVNPTKKPDLDNLAKTVLDALNGRAFKDDSQITHMLVEKHYSHNPRVEVEIVEVTLNHDC